LIIKYFYELEVSPDFKLLSDKERKYLLELSIKEIFDNHIISKDDDFYNLYICYDNKRNDTNLKSIICKLFDYINTLNDYNSWKSNFLLTSYNEDLKKNSACECVFNFIKSLFYDLKNDIDGLSDEATSCYQAYSNFLNLRKQFICEFCDAGDFYQASKVFESLALPNKPRLSSSANVDVVQFDEKVSDFAKEFKNIENEIIEL
jgi:hypothetical protein